MTLRPSNRLAALCAHGAALSVLFVCLAGFDDFHQDALECQDAVSHLASCCGAELDATQFNCHRSEGCSGGDPELDLATSGCIRAMSCDALVASGVCIRAEALAHGKKIDQSVCK